MNRKNNTLLPIHKHCFTLDDSPAARSVIECDLERIVSYLHRKFPGSVIGLWGSFALGEGKVLMEGDKVVYVSDIDITVHTYSLLSYLKIKIKGPTEMEKILSDPARNLRVDLSINWIPFSVSGLAFGGIPVRILKGRGSTFFKRTKIMNNGFALTHVLGACNKLRKYIKDGSRNCSETSESATECLKAFLLCALAIDRATVDKDIKKALYAGSKRGLLELSPLYKDYFSDVQCDIFKRGLLSYLHGSQESFTMEDIRHLRPIYVDLLKRYTRRWTLHNLDYVFKYQFYFKGENVIDKRKGILFYLNPLYYILKDNIKFMESL